MSSQRENVVVDLDKFLGQYRKQLPQRPTDPLDQMMVEQDQMLARDVKRTQAKRILTEETKRLKELEAQIETEEKTTGQAQDTTEVDPKVLEMMVNLEDDKRDRALQVYTAMHAARSGKADAYLMPMILGTMNARPNASATEIVTAVTDIVRLLEDRRQPSSSGVGEIADAMVKVASINKGNQTSETVALVKEIAGIMRPQDGGGGVDPTSAAVTLLTNLKELGVLKLGTETPVNQNGSDEVRIKLAEIKRDTDIKLAELGLKKDLDLRKIEADEKRSDAVGGLVERAARVAGRAFGEGEAEVAGMAEPAPASEVVVQTCPSCKKPIQIAKPEVSRRIQCPHCDAALDYTFTPKDKGPPPPQPPT